MSLFNYMFDSEWAQRADIEDTKRWIDFQRRSDMRARQRLRDDVGSRIQELEDDVGELALFVRTLFRLLAEKGTIGKAEFMETARAIDAQDGSIDGKYTGRLDAP